MGARRLGATPLAFALIGAALALPSRAAVPNAGSPLPDITAEEILAVGNVAPPPAGVGLQVHADFPLDEPFALAGVDVAALTAEITPEGEARVVSMIPARGEEGHKREGRNECRDPSFTESGPRWDAADMPIAWHFKSSSVPGYLSELGTRQAVRKGHRVWPRVLTRCEAPLLNDFHFFFAGPTWKSRGLDGTNSVDFGSLGHQALAVNYTWYTGARIVEVDLRFNRDVRWTNQRDGRRGYHVVNVATHELGHQLGLDDLGDGHGALTMYGRIRRGEHSKTTLGKGDLLGAARLSP